MEQVFRIEIPVEAVDKTDTSALQQLESTLQKLFAAMKQNKATAGEVFDALERSASEAKASVKQVETATEQAASSYEQAGAAAADAGDQQKQAASGAENAAEKLEDTVSEVSDAYDETASAAADAGRKSGTAFNSASSSTDKFTQRVEKSQKTLRQMFKEKFQLIIAAIDRASPVLKTIWNSAKGLAGKTWHVAVRMKDFITAPFRKLWNLVNSPITMALSVAGIGLSANEVLQTFNEFETGMSAVRSLTGATDEEFLSLKETAKDLGASTSFSASEASQGMQYLAMAGWDTNQIIAAMPGLLDLAAAGATELGTAADIVSDVMTAMGMSADQASRAADIFAKTATGSNTTIENLGETLKYAAPIAHSFGLSLEEVSAMAGLMANAGIKGSMAGTAIRSSLLSMASPTKEAATLMKKLGLSFSNTDGSMKDMSAIVGNLQKSFAGLTESQKLQYAETLFGTYASSAWLGVINQGADAFNNFQTSLENSTGAAKEMAAIRLDNLAGDMEELGGAVETAKLELMDKLNPFLRSGVQWLTGKIPEIQAKIESAIDSAVTKIKAIKEHLKGVFGSSEFKNADGFADKFFIAWDKIIAEPFAKWWENGGQETILGAVSRVGENIGKLLHGIIAGIFAALKGEEIDFEGLNLTGVAKAGAEAAKSFVSSFMASFDLGGLASEMPGAMKAGLFGFGAIKIGQGGLGIYRTVTALKTAFSGVTGAATTATAATAAIGKTAATSAVGIAKAGTVLGGLKTALAAIPVWGWVAAAAITALAVGVKLYTDEQARRKQQILNLESTVEGHIATYRREAEEINAITGTVETIREIKINATYEGPGPKEYMDLQTELATLGSRENQLKFLIDTGLNPEKTVSDIKAVQAALVELGYDLGNTGAEGNGVDGIWGDKTQAAFETQMETWKTELAGIQATSAEAQAKLDTMKSDIQSLVDTVTELNALEDPEITITATLNKWGIEDEADIELIKSLASEITTKEGILTITTKLQGYGLTILGISSLQALIKNNELLEQKVRVTLDTETSLTAEQIDDYVNTLKGNKTREIEIELQLEGAAMTYQQIAAINSELQTIKQRKVELSVTVGDGTATEAQIEEYTKLLSREAAIELMLTGVNLTPEQIGALTEEWDGLKTIDSEIYVHMSEAGLKQADITAIKDDIAGIGNADAIISVVLTNASPEAEAQKEAALMEQYERLAGELKTTFGLDLTAEQLASGQYDGLIYGANNEWRENMQRADWYKLKDASEQETQGTITPAQQLIAENQQKISDLQAQNTAQSAAIAPGANLLSLIQALGAEYNNRVRTASDDPDAFNEWREGTYNPALFEAYKAYVNADPETSGVSDDQINEMWNGFLYNGADTPMHETLASMFDGWDSWLFGKQPNQTQRDVESVEATNAEIARLQAEIDAANAGLTAAYGEEKTVATSEAFIGSDYFGKPIEEIAANYTTLDEAAQGMFLQALSALETLNSQTDYISDSDKTSASEMLDLAAKSEIMASIQAQVDGISLKYGEMSNEDLLKLDGLEEGKTTLEAINGALDALGLDKIESMTQIKDALESIAGVDMSKFSVDAAATAIQSLTGDANSGKTSVDALRTALANLDEKTATTTINEYTNKITTYKTNGSPTQNANGGIYDGAMLSWVAEDGPEAIIPLGSKRRGRGIDLWLQAGEMLGVTEFADGGIMAPYTGALEDLPADFDDDDGDGSPKPIHTGSEGGHGGNSFSVSVSANPTFQITGGDSEDILDKLKGKQKELAELFGGALAEQLEDIVANMV